MVLNWAKKLKDPCSGFLRVKGIKTLKDCDAQAPPASNDQDQSSELRQQG